MCKLIWHNKYRKISLYTNKIDNSWRDTVRRVLHGTSSNISGQEYKELSEALAKFEVVPAGRILAGAGTPDHVTLVNTFVIGSVQPTVTDTLETLTRSARTMSMGGGIGIDLSNIPPRGMPTAQGTSPGVLAYAELWDKMCKAILSSDMQRGAMMVVLSCSHPEIRTFIRAKSIQGALTKLNASILVTDDLLLAKTNNACWPLQFAGRVHEYVDPHVLWSEIAAASYESAEPGIIFIDQVNQLNNLNYCETIAATNSCAEQPLPAHGSAPLTAVNLAALVQNPLTPSAKLDLGRLAKLARLGVRFLDRVIDQTYYPHPKQREEARGKRRIGLGIAGLGDALILCRQRYGSADSLDLIRQWLQVFRDASYQASIELARDLGNFPLLDIAAHLERPHIKTLPPEIRDQIARHGIRNGVVNCIAPTGSTALLANNASGGVEPVYAHRQRRIIMMPDHSQKEIELRSWSLRCYLDMFPDRSKEPLPDYFATALEISPGDHLAVQATAQKFIDASISKTINFDANVDFMEFENLFSSAYSMGCKSLSVYRPSEIRGQIISAI